MTTDETILLQSLSFLNPYVVDDLVRHGNEGDGGYVLPSSIVQRVDAVISFGVGSDWSMEQSVVRAHSKLQKNLTVHAYDYTISAEVFLRDFAMGVFQLLLGRISLANLWMRYRLYSSYKKFFSGKLVHFRERIWSCRFNKFDVTIDTVFRRLPNARHVFLKIDIEGREYRILPDILNYSSRIDLLAIEFHDTDLLRSLFEAHVKKILDSFNIVHIHGNNYSGIAADGLPECIEITFLNKRFATTGIFRNRLPVAGLDFPNDPRRPDITLRFADCET